MASDLSDTLTRLRSKMAVLMERYHALEDARDRAETRLEQLTQELQRAHATIERQTAEIDYLRTASVLSPSREGIEDTRALIANLVRDIDRCIEELRS